MYRPSYSQVSDPKLLRDFIKDHSFGALISTANNALNVNHYPFLVEETDSGFTLYTHLARANPQWRDLQSNSSVTAVFTGPHSYVSPLYYRSNLNVPTWNYTAVHVTANAEVIEDNFVRANMMKRLVDHFEKANGTNWDYVLPEEFHSKLMSAIVWLKLNVTRVEGKFKLGQNRDSQDYESLSHEFSKKTSDNDRELYKYMSLLNAHRK